MDFFSKLGAVTRDIADSMGMEFYLLFFFWGIVGLILGIISIVLGKKKENMDLRNRGIKAIIAILFALVFVGLVEFVAFNS